MKEKKHGGDIYTYLDKYQKVPLDFSANVNPAGLPKKVKKALCKSVSKFAPYPDTECRELRKKIAEYEQVAEENLVFGCGAADLIFRIVRTLKPRTALLAAPCFSEYAEALKSEQCSIGYFYLQEQNNFILNKDFLSVIAQPLQIIFICSPNNPTGQVVEKSIVYEILEKANSIGCYVVLDECFMDFVKDKELYSCTDLLNKFNNLIILKAFTKNFAMAGLRLGYAMCADQHLIQLLAECGQPWSVSTPAQVAGCAAVDSKEYLSKSLIDNHRERKYLQKELNKLPVIVFESKANFILFKLLVDLNLSLELYKKGILIRNCANFPGLKEGFFRVAVKKHRDNRQLIKGLKEVFEGAEHG